MYKKWFPLVFVLLSLALVSGCGVQPSGLGLSGNTGGMTGSGYGNIVGFTAEDPDNGGGGGGGGGSAPNEYEENLIGNWANDELQVYVSLWLEANMFGLDSYVLRGARTEYDMSGYTYFYDFTWNAGSSTVSVEYTYCAYYDPETSDYVDIPLLPDESVSYSLSNNNNTLMIQMDNEYMEFYRIEIGS